MPPLVMGTDLLPLARHYSCRLLNKLTIGGSDYCLILDNVEKNYRQGLEVDSKVQIP